MCSSVMVLLQSRLHLQPFNTPREGRGHYKTGYHWVCFSINPSPPPWILYSYVSFVSELSYSLHKPVVKLQDKPGICLHMVYQVETEKQRTKLSALNTFSRLYFDIPPCWYLVV